MTTSSPSQFALFESVLPAAVQAAPLALPIQRGNTIDVRRVARIFGVHSNTANTMVKSHLFVAFRVGTSSWRIDYDSVVDYCNRLRVFYRISDSRVPLPPGRKRRRDEDLLPFPLGETIFMKEACRILDCNSKTATHLIESGTIVAYKTLIGETITVPWRIFRPSVVAYLQALHLAAQPSKPVRSPRP